MPQKGVHRYGSTERRKKKWGNENTAAKHVVPM